MKHRLSLLADSDLDDIWYYVASQSGSTEIADRLIGSITDRFFLLTSHPHLDVPATKICVPAFGPFPSASTSSSTASMTKTW